MADFKTIDTTVRQIWATRKSDAEGNQAIDAYLGQQGINRQQYKQQRLNPPPPPQEQPSQPPPQEPGQAQQQPQGEMAWSDVGRQALQNAPGSAAEFGKAIAQPVLHPVETLQNVSDLAAGGLRKGMRAVLPESVSNYIESTDIDPTAAARQTGVAENVGNFYADRYGSMEGFKRALATDPVGVLADASTVLTGGGGLATKVGTVSKTAGLARTAAALERTGANLSKAGRYTNPLSPIAATARPAGRTAAALLGLTTGTGAETIKEAYRAGKVGGEKAKAFVRNLRGKEEQAAVLPEARDAIANIKQARDLQYDADMAIVHADKTPIDFRPIARKYHDIERSTARGGHQVASDETIGKLAAIKKVLQEWQADPSMHTAGGLDALKQRIDQLMPGKLDAGNAGRVVTEMYNAVRDQIVQSSPAYAKAMKNYETSIRKQTELEKTFSLGKGKSDDAALRKLQSVTRNNANTNYGSRLVGARELEAAGAQTLMPSLAGQALSPIVPRGIVGQVAAGGAGLVAAGGSLLHPGAVALAGPFSPRLVGEGARAVGAAGRYAPSRGALLASRLLGETGGQIGPR